MYGTNPLRPLLKGDGQTLDVQEIFPTLQGEGPFAGWPAIFIRLGGCNLACNFCDTEFESFRSATLAEIIAEVEHLAKENTPLVVVTGGEPLRQPISPLCKALLEKGHAVQVETNGTLWRDLPEAVQIVCSPKASDKGYYPVRPDLLARAQAIKFLVSAGQDFYAEVPELGQSDLRVPVYVQPMDENDEAKNLRNRELAVALAMKHGYRLSLQLHKLLGIA